MTNDNSVGDDTINKLTCFSPIYIQFKANEDEFMKYKEILSQEENSEKSLLNENDLMEVVEQDNECGVCHKVFSDKIDLNLHIRSHGMFYLKMIKPQFENCKNELLM